MSVPTPRESRHDDVGAGSEREGQYAVHAYTMATTSPYHRPEPAVTACSPQSPAHSPGVGGHASSATPTKRERVPWRPVGAGFTALGTPVGIGVLHPVLGEVIAVIEIAVVLIIIGAALFGNLVLSDRAFRLLRWFGNRPEPPGPAPGSS